MYWCMKKRVVEEIFYLDVKLWWFWDVGVIEGNMFVDKVCEFFGDFYVWYLECGEFWFLVIIFWGWEGGVYLEIDDGYFFFVNVRKCY